MDNFAPLQPFIRLTQDNLALWSQLCSAPPPPSELFSRWTKGLMENYTRFFFDVAQTAFRTTTMPA
jgi:hypothetical protein